MNEKNGNDKIHELVSSPFRRKILITTKEEVISNHQFVSLDLEICMFVNKAWNEMYENCSLQSTGLLLHTV